MPHPLAFRPARRSLGLLPALIAAALAVPAMAQEPSDHAAPEVDDFGIGALVNIVPVRSPLGSHLMNRDASGTSWQPDDSLSAWMLGGVGGWQLVHKGGLNGVHVGQGGPRGDDKTYVGGVLSSLARRYVGGGRLAFRMAVSPEPLLGKRGYPQLLAAGGTDDGRRRLVDRQPPSDLFTELSVSYSQSFAPGYDAFVYAGLPGEPAYGPPSFLHRQAANDSPEAPISYRWFDATRITHGVVTVGVARGGWKVETSAFRGREPDQNRYAIETGRLDSVTARLSYNPTSNWALQASWAKIDSPDALVPLRDEARVSASALYARPLGAYRGSVSATLAWSRRDRAPGDALQAWLAEGALRPDGNWTLFARAEQVEQDELAAPGAIGSGQIQTVRRLSTGAVFDFVGTKRARFGVGGLVSALDAPERLGYDEPVGGMAFVRLKIS